MSSWLYDKLFKPVAEQAEKSRRLLVIPDGPLSYLPFGALVRPDGKYLAQSHQAIHTAASATVYVELLKRRRPVEPDADEQPVKIVAFGNPRYPKGNLAPNGIVRSAMERGIFDGGLRPLPYTEREVTEIGKLVVLNLQYFLTERHRAADPIGYRVYEVLRTTIQRAVESGELHLLEGDTRIRNSTVLGFSEHAEAANAVELPRLEDVVPGWSGDLLPDLITARARQVSKVYEVLGRHLLDLAQHGEAFRFKDVVDVLKGEVRRQWASVWSVEAGEVGVEVDEDGLVELVRVVQPEEYDDGGRFEWLLECVPNSIDQRRDDSASNREGLWKIWEYVRGWTADGDLSPGGKLPSKQRLGKLLGIYRGRIAVLLKVLKGLVELCLDREGVVVEAGDRQAQPALRERESRSRTSTERRITS